MLQKTVALQLYLTRKAEFDRRRRRVSLDFDELYCLFATEISLSAIATRAGLSRARMNRIFLDYFTDLFQESGLERRQRRERVLRQEAMYRVKKAFLKDAVMRAILRSAEKAKRRRRIEPIICKKGSDVSKRYRRRAVLVDGTDVEPVCHIQNAVFARSGGMTFGTTTLRRQRLETSRWTIFYIDVPSFRRRILRCRSDRLLKALFPEGVELKNVYIPLDGRPESPLYDFLADQDNWADNFGN